MYEYYWKLREKPFENDQNTAFLYLSRDHREVLVRLLYAVNEGKPLAILTGDTGCGKTFILTALKERVARKGARVGLISNPSSNPLDLLSQVGFAFGLRVENWPKGKLIQALTEHLSSRRSHGIPALLIIDDADTIESLSAYQEIRLLLNLQQEDRPLLTAVLAGHPRLLHMLRRIPSLYQRASMNCMLSPLSEEDVFGYVNHRMRAASGNHRIFDGASLQEVYRSTLGVPRLINNLCDLTLLLGCSERRNQVDIRLVKEAKEEFREFGLEAG